MSLIYVTVPESFSLWGSCRALGLFGSALVGCVCVCLGRQEVGAGVLSDSLNWDTGPVPQR